MADPYTALCMSAGELCSISHTDFQFLCTVSMRLSRGAFKIIEERGFA